jgi:hypothetical protein
MTSPLVSYVAVLLRFTARLQVAHGNMYYTERVLITCIRHKHRVLQRFCLKHLFMTHRVQQLVDFVALCMKGLPLGGQLLCVH